MNLYYSRTLDQLMLYDPINKIVICSEDMEEYISTVKTTWEYLGGFD